MPYRDEPSGTRRAKPSRRRTETVSACKTAHTGAGEEKERKRGIEERGREEEKREKNPSEGPSEGSRGRRTAERAPAAPRGEQGRSAPVSRGFFLKKPFKSEVGMDFAGFTLKKFF